MTGEISENIHCYTPGEFIMLYDTWYTYVGYGDLVM